MKLVPVTILLLILIGAAGIAANDTVTVPTSPSPSIQAGTGTGNGHRSLLLNLFRSRQSCVQTEQALREKLTTGGVVELCRGSTITLQSEIDISNMSFDLRCQKTKSLFRFRNRRPSKCVISGADQTRLFIGRPVSVVFQGIHFSNARNANGSDSGGAISILGGLANFKQCTFSANQARVAGALFVSSLSSSVTVDDCAFDDNEATVRGGAIFAIDGAELAITGSSFSSNKSKGGGSTMVVMSDSTVFVRDSIIANGNTDDGNGAVFAQDSAKINLKSTVFSRNIQKGTFNDVFVVEFGSAFVDCDATARVFFCNGFDGITSNAAFTNCAQNGIDDATAPECAIA